MRIKLLVGVIALFSFSFAIAQTGRSPEEIRPDLSVKKDTAYANTLYDLASSHSIRGEIDSTLFYLRLCRNFSEKIGYMQEVCRSTWGMADMYMRKDMPDTALNFLIKAFGIIEKIKPDSLRPYYKLQVLNRIGDIYLSMEDYENGGKYLTQRKQLATELKDTNSLIDTYRALAYYYSLLKDSVSAGDAFKKGWEFCNEYEKAHKNELTKMYRLNRQRILFVQSGIGIFKQPELEKEALIFLEKMWQNKDDPGVKYNVEAMVVPMAKLYQLTGNNKKAIEFGNICMNDTTTYRDYLFDLYPFLAYAYEGIGDYKNAYKYFQLYTGEYQANFETERIAALTSLEKKYQVEKKEQEIATLSRDKRNQRIVIGISIGAFVVALILLVFIWRANRLQKKLFAKEKELQKKEMEKRMSELEQTALRAQMNPHFIFNSLNSVQRFVINNDVEGVNQYLSTFANLIRQTLENSGKQLIPLSHEVKYLETYLKLEQMRSNDKFNYRININPDVDPEETYIPNMIIQPYLENSVIHGMAGKKQNEGVINLTISKNHKLTCVVEDNGVGIAASKANRLKIDMDHESMGTAITEKRIEMFNTVNNEKIELEVIDKSGLSQQENGTKIMIKFPLTSSAN